MKVKFANGVVVRCTAPMEQKIIRTNGSETIGIGWVLVLKLSGDIASAELDELVTAENVKSLEFLTENENGEQTKLFSLDGYDKITASTIHHAENAASAFAEIQMSKGV